MKSMNKFRFLAGAAMLGLTFAMSSCVRKGFDAPPDDSQYDPQVQVTTTIAQMLKMVGPYTSTAVYADTTFTQDMVISGVVTADDRSGNYYKQIVIQDSTAGIAININSYSLYAHYPVGRKLYVKLKGMTLSYDGGLPVLGLGLTEQRAVKGLESSDIDNHIIRANIGNVVKDTVISLATAKAGNPFFYNRLVTIADVEFLDTVHTYTDPSVTTNRYVAECASSNPSTAQQLVVRTSNYANFHGITLPSGHGNLTGIYTIYQSSASNKTAQIIVRDTSDVKFYNTRCGGGGGPVNPGTGALITIDSMRKLYTGGTVTLGSYKITGIIISDIDNKNFSSGNFIIEDNSRKGAIIYIPSSTIFKVGDSVVVDLTGAQLKTYNGALEIDNMTTAKVSKIAGGKTIDPLQVTVANLLANFAQYESTLVKVVNGTLTGGPTYGATNVYLTDDGGTSKIQLFTTAGNNPATFASQNIPTTSKTFVAVVTPYNTTKELKLRNPATDVY